MTLKKPDPSRSSFDYIGSIQLNVRGPAGLPLVKPPYSRLTAYDMTKGDIAWTVPLGDGPTGHPALRELGLEKLGSGARGHVLVTDTLLFVATGQRVFELPEMAELELLGENAVGELDAAIEEEAGGSEAASEPAEWTFEPSRLSAYDKKTGELLWSTELAEEIGGSPISYLHEGKQYIVFAIGGQAEPAKLVAYGLR